MVVEVRLARLTRNVAILAWDSPPTGLDAVLSPVEASGQDVGQAPLLMGRVFARVPRSWRVVGRAGRTAWAVTPR